MDNRDIDKLIAKKVMGWTEIRESGFTGFDFVGLDPKHKPTDWYLIPHYSTDISAAWQVAEKLKLGGFFFEIASGGVDQTYSALFANGEYIPYDDFWTNEYSGTHSLAPMAICLAALDTIGVEIKADSDPRP